MRRFGRKGCLRGQLQTKLISECFALRSGTKKEHKPKLLSPDIFWWVRGLPREGVGGKKFGMPLETREIKLFLAGYRGIFFAGISRNRPKCLRKKSLCSLLGPYQGCPFVRISGLFFFV